jgi:hypothetical protein
MLKKIISLGLLTIMISSVFAYTNTDINNANYLAEKGIIRDLSSTPAEYRLENYIARVEVMGILLTMTNTQRNTDCRGDYPEIDMSGRYGEWVCRTVETVADKGFINDQKNVAKNYRSIRPYDYITRSEALGILMEAFPDDGAYAGYSYYWSENFPKDGLTTGYKDYHYFASTWQAVIFYGYIRKVTDNMAELHDNPRVNGLARIKEIFVFAREIMENK